MVSRTSEEKRKRKINLALVEEISHKYDEEYFISRKSFINKLSKKLFTNVRVSGSENLADVKNAIFVGNHVSLADIPIAMDALTDLGFRPKFVGGNNLYYRFFTRSPSILPDLKKCGMISIDRARFEKKDLEYIDAFRFYMASFFENDKDLFFYPEGGRSYTGFLKDFKTGLFDLVSKHANNSTIIPVYTNFDLVIDAPGFENGVSSKHMNSGKFKKFWSDFKLFYKHHNSKNSLNNSAYINFGEPISVKEKSVSDLVSQTRSALINSTMVSCANISSFVIRNFDDFKLNNAELTDLIDYYVHVTPENNLSPKVINYKENPRRILVEGINLINTQKHSLKYNYDGVTIKNNFLINYYANSVSDFYEDLLSKKV